jgi:putative transcriptional regulator
VATRLALGGRRMKTRLRVLRAEREWSQAELAVHVGVSRACINAIETGRYDPSLVLAFKIARVFDKNVEEVFLYQADKPTNSANPGADSKEPHDV